MTATVPSPSSTPGTTSAGTPEGGRSTRSLLALPLGFAATTAGAVAIAKIEELTGTSPLWLTAMYVFAWGAMFAGVAIGALYVGLLRLLQVRADLLVKLVGIVAVPVGVYLLSEYLTWGSGDASGSYRDVLSFTDFLRIRVTDYGLVTERYGQTVATVDRVGAWGYGIVAAQLVGLGAATALLLVPTGQRPYCNRSQRYLRRSAQAKRFIDDAGSFEQISVHLAGLAQAGRLSEARAAVEAVPAPAKRSKRAPFRVTASDWECGHCGARQVIVEASVFRNNTYIPIDTHRAEVDSGSVAFTS